MGALARQIGRFELADRSTIFLDEIGDLPAVRVKLLRVLEERQIERLGLRPTTLETRLATLRLRRPKREKSEPTVFLRHPGVHPE